MHICARVVLAAACLAATPSLVHAKVHITVDLSRQTMHVDSANETFDWKVSTGKFGYETPNGTYGVLWTDKDHYSEQYDNAPMPDAIFFRPGYAIHGAYKSAFGHPASHGCVRLPVAKAEILFDLVKAEGAEIRIVGSAPVTGAHKPRQGHDEPLGDAMPGPNNDVPQERIYPGGGVTYLPFFNPGY